MGSRLRPLFITTDGAIPRLDFQKMSSKTTIPKDLGGPETDRQADRERLLLKARNTTLETRNTTLAAEKATLEEELETLRVDSALQLQDIQDKDAIIEKLRTTTNLTQLSIVGDVQDSEAKLAQEVKGSLMADLEARSKIIREKDEVIESLQKTIQTLERDRLITEGGVRNDHLLEGQIEQFQHYQNKHLEQIEQLRSSQNMLEKQKQQLQDNNHILKSQNQQLEDLKKALLNRLQTFLAVTENLINNEGPKQERLGSVADRLKVSVQHANSRFDYLASKANKDPAPHVKKNADRASSEATAISDCYVKLAKLAGELSDDFGKARTVAANIRRDFDRLLATTGPVHQVQSTQSSKVLSTDRAWTSGPSGAERIAMPSGSATAMSPTAKVFSPGNQPTQRKDNPGIIRKHEPTPQALSKNTTVSAGKDKLPVTEDDQGFTPAPLGKPAYAKRDLNWQSLEGQASSKTPFVLLHDDGQRLPELPGRGDESTDSESVPTGPTRGILNAGQQDKKADFASRPLISPKNPRESLVTESLSSKSPSTAKVAIPATPPAAPQDLKSASRTELHADTKLATKPAPSPNSAVSSLGKRVLTMSFSTGATPLSPSPSESMAQVAAKPPLALTHPNLQEHALGRAYLLKTYKEDQAKRAKEEAEKADIKSKVPGSKKIADAAPGKVVEPGKPRASKVSEEMQEITQMLGGKLPGKWGDSEELDHPNQDENKASESSSSQQRPTADVPPPQASAESPRNPTGVGSSLSNQSGQVARNLSENIGSAPTTANEGQAVRKESPKLVEGVKVESPIQSTNATNSQSGDTAPVDKAAGKAVAFTAAPSGSAPSSASVILGKRKLEDEVMYKPQSNPPKRSKKGKNKEVRS